MSEPLEALELSTDSEKQGKSAPVLDHYPGGPCTVARCHCNPPVVEAGRRSALIIKGLFLTSYNKYIKYV